MANILDYLDWRGDLTLEERAFNEVDNLILAELCFLELEGIVPADFSARIPIFEAVQRFEQKHPEDHMGVLVSEQIPELARRAVKTPRFSALMLCGYRTELDENTETQFAAVTFLLPDDTAYVAFRGTDDTIVGWKENFNLGFLPEVPAQKQAAAYLTEAVQELPCPILVGGHSKGGHLAIYSALVCGQQTQSRIRRIYNNDGPGFQTSALGTPEHNRILDRICTIVPESSVVGMLLEHEQSYEVVKSTQNGLWQHDGFSWQVQQDHFVHLPERTEESKRTEHALHSFRYAMPAEQRLAFTDALFEIIGCTDAQTLTDLKNGGIKTAAAMLKKYNHLDAPTKKALDQTALLLVRSSAKTAADEISPKLRSAQQNLVQKIVSEMEEELIGDRQKEHNI